MSGLITIREYIVTGNILLKALKANKYVLYAIIYFNFKTQSLRNI